MIFRKKHEIYTTNYLVCKKGNIRKENPEENIVRREMAYYRELINELERKSLAVIAGNKIECDFEETIYYKDRCAHQHSSDCIMHTFTYIMPDNISVRIKPDLFEIVWAEVTIKSTSKKEPEYIKRILEDIGQIVGKYNNDFVLNHCYGMDSLMGEFLFKNGFYEGKEYKPKIKKDKS